MQIAKGKIPLRPVASFGPYHMAPAKTRIAFMGRGRFAALNAVSADSITVSFTWPRPLRSRRFQKVTELAPG